MRAKLLSFSEYAATLLPHKTAYLLAIQQFEDKVKLSILQHLHQNCVQIQQITENGDNISDEGGSVPSVFQYRRFIKNRLPRSSTVI